jgi:hypothetical protein
MARQLDILADGTPVETGTTQSIATPVKNEYTDVEAFTGEYWIDGKPIYRRTFIKTFAETGAVTEVLDGSGIISDIVKSEVTFHYTSGFSVIGQIYYITADPTTLAFIIQVTANNNHNITIWRNVVNSGYLNGVYTITAYYTKTTD